MTGPKASAFDLTFGPALRKRLAAERRDPERSRMIPGFLLARNEGEETEHLMHGYYEAEKADKEGIFQLFEAEGIRFFVPQPQVRELLAGKHLDLDEKARLTAKPRKA